MLFIPYSIKIEPLFLDVAFALDTMLLCLLLELFVHSPDDTCYPRRADSQPENME